MKGRRVLLLCYFFPPLGGGGVHRVLGFARHLPRFGWSCTVVCAGEEDYWVRDDSLAVPPDSEVIRVRGGSAISSWLKAGGASGGRRSGSAFGALRRLSDWWLLPDSYRGWARRARHAALSRVGRGDIDALWSSSPPESVHLAARDVAAKTRLPWVADFRDPWIPLAFRKPPTGWHRTRQEAMERSVVERADRVIAASRLHADTLRARLPAAAASRVLHLPNGFEPSSDLLAADPPEAAQPFLIVFTGTMAQQPDTEVLLEAVHDLLARHPEARRRLRVDLLGPYESGYEDRSVALGLRGIVRFGGPRPHADTRRTQHRADVLMLLKPGGPMFRTMVPGKLYEYLEARRPIVALIDERDEATDLLRRANQVVLPPGRRDVLTDELERRYLDWRAHGRAPDIQVSWIDEHERRRLAERLASTLDGLVPASAR